jgi:phage gp29-like protein
MIKFNIFQRKKRPLTAPTAVQLTLADRRALELPGVGNTLPPSAYTEMEGDAMVQTALTIKKMAVLAAEYRIEPASGSPTARRNAAFIAEVFARMDGSPRSILTGAMDAFARGWSVQEMLFAVDGSRVVLTGTQPKDPQHFGLEMDAFGHLRGLIHRIPGEAEKRLPRGKFVLYRNRLGYGHPKGKSDLDSAYRHFQSKKALVMAWRAHLERFASPTVLGKYARGLPAEEQTGILDALKRLHDNTAIVFPNEIEVSTLHGRESDNNAFQEAIEFHNREIARSILGQTLTTDEGRRVGSLALGKVHLQVLLLQVDALRRELADVVMTEQVIKPLIEMNFGPGEVPRFVFEEARLGAFVAGEV